MRTLKILAIETAAESCSAALLIGTEVRERFLVQPRGHSELILGMMDELLVEAGLRLADLDALAFGRGPGSFTGVRIATGVVQGAAFAAELPVVPISTLAALAQGLVRESGARRILPAFDARMGEVYWAAYEVGERGLVHPCLAEEVAPADRVSLPSGGDWHGAGSGWRTYGAVLGQRLGAALAGVSPDLLTSARDVALLGADAYARGLAVAAELALPVYLRDRVAAKPGPPEPR